MTPALKWPRCPGKRHGRHRYGGGTHCKDCGVSSDRDRERRLWVTRLFRQSLELSGEASLEPANEDYPHSDHASYGAASKVTRCFICESDIMRGEGMFRLRVTDEKGTVVTIWCLKCRSECLTEP